MWLLDNLQYYSSECIILGRTALKDHKSQKTKLQRLHSSWSRLPSKIALAEANLPTYSVSCDQKIYFNANID